MRLGLANMTAGEQRDKLPHKYRIQLMCGHKLANAGFKFSSSKSKLCSFECFVF